MPPANSSNIIYIIDYQVVKSALKETFGFYCDIFLLLRFEIIEINRTYSSTRPFSAWRSSLHTPIA